jgi:hypothetical protein
MYGRHWFSIFGWFVEEKIKYENGKNLLILKFEQHQHFWPAPFISLSLVNFSSVHHSLDVGREGQNPAVHFWHFSDFSTCNGRLSEENFSGTQPGFLANFRIKGCFLNAAISSLGGLLNGF